jgi:hypothetical protein
VVLVGLEVIVGPVVLVGFGVDPGVLGVFVCVARCAAAGAIVGFTHWYTSA